MIGHERRTTGLAGTLLGVFAALWVALAGLPLAPNGTPAPAGSTPSAQQPAGPASTAQQPAGPSSSGRNSPARETGSPLPARRQQSGPRASDRAAGGRADWLRAAAVRQIAADAGGVPALLAATVSTAIQAGRPVRLPVGLFSRPPRAVAAAHRARAPPPAA